MTCCAHTTQVRVGLLWMTRVCPNDVQRGRLFCDEHGRDCAVCGHELECDTTCEDCDAEGRCAVPNEPDAGPRTALPTLRGLVA